MAGKFGKRASRIAYKSVGLGKTGVLDPM
jgi:hypothetical protein